MKTKLFTVLLVFTHLESFSQNTLPAYIELARHNSTTSQSIQTTLQLAQVNYSLFRSQYKPSLSLTGNIPSFNKDNFEVRQPDGSIRFLNRSQNFSDIGISFTQPLPFSGGTISLNTALRRFDDFVAKTQQYNGTPVFVQLQQPLFAFNQYKWDKKTEPLKLQEATITARLQLLQLEYDICRSYFDIVEAQTNHKLSAASLNYCLTNLAIEKRRVQLGVSTEEKILQLEIQQLNIRQQLETDSLAIAKNFILLSGLTGRSETTTPLLEIPETIVMPVISPALLTDEKILQLYALTARRKTLEAKSNTARIKAENNQVTLTVSYGLTNAASTIPSIYRSPNDQQRFSIGFAVPVASWGKRKNSLAAARLQEKQVELNNKKELESLKTELESIIIQLPLLQKDIQRSLITDTLTGKRLSISSRLYQSGKISLLELQAAQTDQENARRNYIRALRKYWEIYYLVRAKTGLDL